MQKSQAEHLDGREAALAAAMREVATELRLINAADFVNYIRLDRFSHIEALVNSAAELHFRSGILRFGSSADLHFDWGAAPTVWLDMIFENMGVRVHFSLVLESCQGAVQIEFMELDPPCGEPEAATERLIAAIRGARREPGLDASQKPALSLVAH